MSLRCEAVLGCGYCELACTNAAYRFCAAPEQPGRGGQSQLGLQQWFTTSIEGVAPKLPVGAVDISTVGDAGILEIPGLVAL